MPDDRRDGSEPAGSLHEGVTPVATEVPVKWRAPASVVGLFVLGVLYTMYFAASFLIPVVAAFVLALLLAPLVRWLGRSRLLPPPVAAIIVLMALAGTLAGAFYALAAPASDWISRMPEIVEQVQWKLRDLSRPIEQVKEASKQVEAAIESRDAAPERVVVESPSLINRVFSTLQSIGVQLTLMLVLLYFLLAVGDLFKEKLIHVMSRLSDKKRALLIVRQVEHDVSHYLFTICLINIALGIVIGLGLYAIGMPNPALWGAMAALLNFVPYIGMVVGTAIVTLVALITFPTAATALWVMAIYAVPNSIEGEFLTPAIVGRRLTINPVVLFLALAFGSYIWGVAGALMAVPLLVAIKALCDNVESLQAVGEFLSGPRPRTNGTVTSA